jgi:hypothetical protein
VANPLGTAGSSIGEETMPCQGATLVGPLSGLRRVAYANFVQSSGDRSHYGATLSGRPHGCGLQVATKHAKTSSQCNDLKEKCCDAIQP